MKRLSSSDSVGAFMSICPSSTDDHGENADPIYRREIDESMMDEEGCVEESGSHNVPEKKRRLNLEQVKALEKNFEVENKLEPERKVKLAQELGLQPRQVAVWFQNRRARWKTKQLERDYAGLKANHDSLLHKYQALQRDNQSLLKQIEELKSKMNEDGRGNSKVAVKEEAKLETPETDFNLEIYNRKNRTEVILGGGDFRDGSSDSDSSAILNEDSPMGVSAAAAAAILSPTGGILDQSPHQFLDIHNFPDCNNVLEDSQKAYQPQFVKTEEHDFFGEESCSGLFSDEQPPTLSWCCCSDEWD